MCREVQLAAPTVNIHLLASRWMLVREPAEAGPLHIQHYLVRPFWPNTQ